MDTITQPRIPSRTAIQGEADRLNAELQSPSFPDEFTLTRKKAELSPTALGGGVPPSGGSRPAQGSKTRTITRILAFLAAAAVLAAGAALQAQGPRGNAANARTSAPVDLTGYWVSVVSEDWRMRMATPRKGDYESLSLTAEGRRVADAWDLAKDDAAGLQCKAYGVGGIIRQPGRLHIEWQDDAILKVDFDAGSQTRLLRFGRGAAAGEKSWQGHSIAEWENPPGGRGGAVRAQLGNSTGPVAPGGGGRGQRGGPAPTRVVNQGGSLKVVTSNFREGYLRKNGVPYSENASITEYFHRLPSEAGEDSWLLVIAIVEDPRYHSQPFYTSTQFKLEPDGAKWAPAPCRTAPPPPPTPKRN